MSFKSRTIPAFVAGTMLVGAAGALAEPTQQAVQSELDSLRARVAQLENSAATNQKDFDATIQSVLSDADSRTFSLAVDDASPGWNRGKFQIGSPDGVNTLALDFQLQVRHVLNYSDQDNASPTASGDFVDGFEIRRAELGISGTLFSKNTRYAAEWETNRSGGAVTLKSFVVEHMFADGLYVGGGQFVDPQSFEQLVSSKRQLAAERSLANTLIHLDSQSFVQGVYVKYATQQVQVIGAFHDGLGSRNTSFVDGNTTSTSVFTSAYWGISGRVDFALAGTLSPTLRDFTAMGVKEDNIRVGAGLDITQFGAMSTSDGTAYLYSIDASYEGPSGLGLYAAWLGNYVDVQNATLDEINLYGIVIQASYLFNPEWEVFGRFDWTHVPDDDLVTAEENYTEFTLGVNYYAVTGGHASKWTIDLNYLPNGAPGYASLSGMGYFGGTGYDGEAQWALRTQYQLLIGNK